MSSDGKLSFPKEPLSLCYYNEDRNRVVCIESTSIASDGKVLYQLKPGVAYRPGGARSAANQPSATRRSRTADPRWVRNEPPGPADQRPGRGAGYVRLG